MKTSAAMALQAVIVLLLTGCGPKGKPGNNAATHTRNEPYKGAVQIACDPALQPIISQQVEVFSFLYDSVQASIEYVNEADALQQFTEGETQVLLLARELTGAEKEQLKGRDTIYVREVAVAYDAVALIGHPASKYTNLNVDYLKQLFNPATKQSDVKMVFEGNKASSVAYVLGLLGYKNETSPNVYAMKSVDEVIDYAAANENVIGFVPYSFLSDTDDERVKKILKRIKILSLRLETEKEGERQVSANQSDIAEGVYPLTRRINAVTRYGFADTPDRLFVSFLYKGKGAKVFLKAGLVPVKMPEREINVNTEGLKPNN